MVDLVRRAVISCFMLLLASGTVAAQSFVDLSVEPAGPLELRANPITLDNPMPALILGQPPAYPGEAAGSGAAGTMVFRLTIDDTGSVAEARYIGHDRYALREVKGRLEAAPMLDSVFLAAAENALKGWLYEPPVDAPIAIDVEFAFAGNGRVRQVWLEPAQNLERGQPVVPPGQFAADPGQPALARIGSADANHPDARAAVAAVPPPRRIKDVKPVYPPDAREKGIAGIVVADIAVDENGRVSDARIVRSIPLLDEAALDAVRGWVFEPTLLNGQPVSLVLTVTVNFTLQR
jgi:TonB family protein